MRRRHTSSIGIDFVDRARAVTLGTERVVLAVGVAPRLALIVVRVRARCDREHDKRAGPLRGCHDRPRRKRRRAPFSPFRQDPTIWGPRFAAEPFTLNTGTLTRPTYTNTSDTQHTRGTHTHTRTRTTVSLAARATRTPQHCTPNSGSCGVRKSVVNIRDSYNWSTCDLFHASDAGFLWSVLKPSLSLPLSI